MTAGIGPIEKYKAKSMILQNNQTTESVAFAVYRSKNYATVTYYKDWEHIKVSDSRMTIEEANNAYSHYLNSGFVEAF